MMLILLLTLFQFHKGTIKTAYLAKALLVQQNFNSIKVRLKLQSKLESAKIPYAFQFHKGTIKTSKSEIKSE